MSAAERINCSIPRDSPLRGSVTLAARAPIDAVGEAEGVAVAPVSLGAFTDGAFAIVDEDNDGAAMNIKLIAWHEARARLNLAAAGPALDPRTPPAPTVHTCNSGCRDGSRRYLRRRGRRSGDLGSIRPTRQEPGDRHQQKLGLDVYDLT
jgi:hypothetical protein